MSLRNLEQVYVGGKLVADGLEFPAHDAAQLRREIDTRTDRLRAFATADDLIFEAKAAQSAGDAAKAFALYDQAVATAPTYAEPLIERGLLKFNQGDRPAGAADFDLAVAADPQSARALAYRANLTHHYVNRDWAAAEADYAAVLAIEPQFPRFYAHTAELYLYSGDPARAIAEAGKGIAREPDNFLHHLNLAHGLLFTGDIEEAKRLYLEVSQESIEGGEPGAKFALGDLAHIEKIGAVKYPQIAIITPWLKSLVRE